MAGPFKILRQIYSTHGDFGETTKMMGVIVRDISDEKEYFVHGDFDKDKTEKKRGERKRKWALGKEGIKALYGKTPKRTTIKDRVIQWHVVVNRFLDDAVPPCVKAGICHHLNISPETQRHIPNAPLLG